MRVSVVDELAIEPVPVVSFDIVPLFVVLLLVFRFVRPRRDRRVVVVVVAVVPVPFIPVTLPLSFMVVAGFAGTVVVVVFVVCWPIADCDIAVVSLTVPALVPLVPLTDVVEPDVIEPLVDPLIEPFMLPFMELLIEPFILPLSIVPVPVRFELLVVPEFIVPLFMVPVVVVVVPVGVVVAGVELDVAAVLP